MSANISGSSHPTPPHPNKPGPRASDFSSLNVRPGPYETNPGRPIKRAPPHLHVPSQEPDFEDAFTEVPAALSMERKTGDAGAE